MANEISKWSENLEEVPFFLKIHAVVRPGYVLCYEGAIRTT